VSGDQIELGLDEGESLRPVFRQFHKFHPEIWQKFREETFLAYNNGEQPIRGRDIMARVKKKVHAPMVMQFTRFYEELFTTNHQELADIFSQDDDDKEQGSNG